MEKQTNSVSEDSDRDLEGQQQTGVKGWCRNNWRFMLLVGIPAVMIIVVVVVPIVALKKDGKEWSMDNHEKALKDEFPSFGNDNSTSRTGSLPTGSIIRTASSADDSSDSSTAFSGLSITAEIVPTDTERRGSAVETSPSEPVATATD